MSSPESIIEMATAKKPEKDEKSGVNRPEKTQEQLRGALEKRFGALTGELRESLDNYDAMLETGDFEDKDGEESGAGEKRKEQFQSKIESMMNRAEKVKATIDSKEELPQLVSTIEAIYQKESITLDLEAKTKEFLDLYQKTGLDLPPDFEESIAEIWNRNSTEIQEAIEQNGFDDVLLVPGNISLPELADKMKMEKGNYEYGNFKEGGGFAGAVSSNVDKPRLVLVHKAQNLKDRPELAKTRNTKGQDVKLDQALTLEDYLVFQRKYFEETGKHLDEDGWTWLATKSGARLVDAGWDPDSGELCVGAGDLGVQDEGLGVRPSRSFF